MKKTCLYTTLLLAMFVVLLSSCATEKRMTVGDKMISQSTNTRDLGEQWNKGNAMVIKGEALKKEGTELVKEGNDRVKQGEDKITEGERIMAEGHKMIEESEMLFQNRFPLKKLE